MLSPSSDLTKLLGEGSGAFFGPSSKPLCDLVIVDGAPLRDQFRKIDAICVFAEHAAWRHQALRLR